MLSVRAVIGFHVGRTGDFDAVLLAFLLAGLYFFLLYFDFEQPRALYLAALFWGLAFLTKGPAMAVLWPGLGLYIVLQKRLKELLLDRKILPTYFAISTLSHWLVYDDPFFGYTARQA